ncbi:MAG: hypothetical protein JW876_07415 [Candidatus Krumholzibacteriota bacterium]|nr:hypothetical protein [Candidatus Krumholzibacteriota bacterium]
MNPGRRIVLVAVVAAAIVVLIVILFANRGDVARKIYLAEGERLVERIPPDYRDRYTEELRYTLDKFWSAWEGGYVTRNDLTDVTDRMRSLNAQDEVTRMEIFDFIGDVSRLYTDAFNEERERRAAQEQDGG